MKINIAGVFVDNITKQETLQKLGEFVRSGQPHYIVTVYSEFIVFANRDQKFLEVLNKADLSLPDGMGVVWAGNFLSNKKVFSERVSGSELIWDIAKLAAENNYTIALVGGEDNVAVQSAQALESKFPGLKVNLAVSDRPFDEATVKKIAESNSDILCIAYAPPRQEIWIADILSKLNVKAAIGLGGTFDYIAGKRKKAPSWMSGMGLEWFWRLITQPKRIKRIWNAVPVFVWIICKYKLNHLRGKS